MKALYTALFLLIAQLSFSQCISNFQWPSQSYQAQQYSDEAPLQYSTVAGAYTIIENIQYGQSYEISSSIPSDYITVTDVYVLGILLEDGPSPLVMSTDSRDRIAVHVHYSSPMCGEQTTETREITITCTSCTTTPSKVGVNSLEPSATLEINGAIKVGENKTTASAGMIRWNENTLDFEGYNGSEWISLTKASGSWGRLPNSEVNESFISTTSVNETTDQLGYDIAIGEEYAVVSSKGSNSKISLHFYKREETGWVLHYSRPNVIQTNVLNFTTTVAIDGEEAILGIKYDDDFESGATIVYRYKRNGTQWNKIQTIDMPFEAINGSFGQAIAIEGDHILIGAQNQMIDGDQNKGKVFYYKKTNSEYELEQSITNTGNPLFGNFGWSVDIDGEYAVIGAPSDDIIPNELNGSISIYKYINGDWIFQEKKHSGNGQVNSFYGSAVSIEGDYIAVGAKGQTEGGFINHGAVYVYKKQVNTWTLHQVVKPNEILGSSEFGKDVKLKNGYLLIGAPKEPNTENEEMGAAYLFRLQGDQWVQEAKIKSSNASVESLFGNALDMNTNMMMIGAHQQEIDGINKGAVYFIQKN